ncbi:hypothetical protein [Gemmobacter nectariphilus]|uniref:hypothetical protein n=1 Tax=Gemmobacter nectariphilus TaxID=220343 RepID=UPI0013784F88|nr:hypothetical protein [Gemmobacter nectariphilus]
MRVLPPPGFLVGILAGLGTALYLAEAPVLSKDAVADVQPGVARPLTPLDVPRQPLTELEQVLADFAERPLLAENRILPRLAPSLEPDEPEPTYAPEMPEPESEPAADLLPLEFAGFMRLNDISRVLVRNPESGDERWMVVGDKVGDWTLVEITQEQLFFSMEGIQRAILLRPYTLP